MRTRLRNLTSLLLGLVLWTSVSTGPRAYDVSDRSVGAPAALAIDAQGLPSSVVQVARTAAHVSHPAPRSALAMCAGGFTSFVPRRSYHPPIAYSAPPCRAPALAFPYDATAPPVRLEH